MSSGVPRRSGGGVTEPSAGLEKRAFGGGSSPLLSGDSRPGPSSKGGRLQSGSWATNSLRPVSAPRPGSPVCPAAPHPTPGPGTLEHWIPQQSALLAQPLARRGHHAQGKCSHPGVGLTLPEARWLLVVSRAGNQALSASTQCFCLAGAPPRGGGSLHWVGEEARLSGPYRDTTPSPGRQP